MQAHSPSWRRRKAAGLPSRGLRDVAGGKSTAQLTSCFAKPAQRSVQRHNSDKTEVKKKWLKACVTKGVGHSDPTTTFTQSFWNTIFEGIRFYFDWIWAKGCCGKFLLCYSSRINGLARSLLLLNSRTQGSANCTIGNATENWYNINPNGDFIL